MKNSIACTHNIFGWATDFSSPDVNSVFYQVMSFLFYSVWCFQSFSWSRQLIKRPLILGNTEVLFLCF